MRINKYLATAGLGSRRKVEELIANGCIKVNGVITTSLSTVIDEHKDVVTYLDKQVSIIDTKVYYALNKPKGVLCACSDARGRKIVTDLVPSIPKVFPVGRLDYETEGLIILTNDGDFANNIIHPSKKIAKTYEVVTDKSLNIKDKVLLEKGILIDGVITLPAVVQNDVKTNNGFKRLITIFEGRNRQIRKMFASIGHKVINLKRISIGSLNLGNLELGKYKLLTEKDLSKIFRTK